MRFFVSAVARILTLRHRIGEVDEVFYFAEYPDVARSGSTAASHYGIYGKGEGRHPNRASKWLSASAWQALFVGPKYYLARSPEIAAAGFDPRVHYELWGRANGHPANRYSEYATDFLKRATRRFRTCRAALAPSAHPVLPPNQRDLFDFARSGRLYRARIEAFVQRRLASRLPVGGLIAGVFKIARLPDDKGPWRIAPLANEKSYTFCEPPVHGKSGPPVVRTVPVSRQWIATIDDAAVIGGFQVVSDGNLIVYEPAGDPALGFVAGAWPYTTAVNDRSAAVWFEFSSEDRLPEGILLSGRCSPNYFHWLIEYLARAYLLSQRPDLKHVPIIVDAEMFPQEFESLQTVLPDWPVHRMRRSSVLKVDRLYVPSQHTFHPDSPGIPFWRGSAICTDTLSFLRTTVLARLGIANLGPPHRRLYLARRRGRNIVNHADVERVVEEFGFEVVDPSALTFAEQVRLFCEAKYIAGAMGAAFSNLIFASPGGTVIGLCSPFATGYSMQANLAAFAGCSYVTLPGEHPRYEGETEGPVDLNLLLESFEVDPARLRQCLLDVLEKNPGELENPGGVPASARRPLAADALSGSKKIAAGERPARRNNRVDA
jgi:capsular polysaccharide biosynthesis protein